MCGIAGRLGERLSADEAGARVEACLARLSHRGPDGHGVHAAPTAGEGEVTLLHARLSILDLSPSAAQPFRSEDGRLTLVFNGEIYNFIELRRELEQEGCRFLSSGDTEVVLRAYERWGDGFLSRLRGMFALALWDDRRQTLLVARDRLGIKPLFWAVEGGTFVFASELRPLFALAPVSRERSAAGLDDFFTYLYVPPPRTIYAHVHELPLAHLLKVRRVDGQVRCEEAAYWQLPRGRLVVDEVEAARLVRAELETVVRQHVLADVPLGAFLSGGLDSTAIVGLMARNSSKPVRTFCMTFGPDEELFDERQYARVVADHYATEHTSVPVRPNVAELLPRMVRHFGQPFGNPTALLVAELSRESRKSVKVALAGDGGDEIFLGYPRYVGMRVKAAYSALPERLRAGVARLANFAMTDSLRGRHMFRRAREFLTTGLQEADDAYVNWVSYFSAQERDHLLTQEVRSGIGRHRAEDYLLGLLAGTRAEDPAERAALADVQSFLPGNLLAYGDRMSMMHGLEVRVPFCDHVLVELLAGIEPSIKLKNRSLKWLMRKAVADLLPPRIARRGKLGFNPPMGLWLNGPLRHMVAEVASRPSDALREVVAPDAVARLVGEHKDAKRDRSLHVWSILVLDAWMQADREEAQALDQALRRPDRRARLEVVV
jgi:asparagine synthase (glutamine-hydrolysing)